ncbi:MAG: NAD-binding protein [Armatimonadetes bacterium]|nr:NAD-binding protein [Armatimonadota bacterium]
MTGHFVICGCGQVGFRVAMLVHRLGLPLSIVTTDLREPFNEIIAKEGFRVVYGDARNEAVLTQAGVPEARAVIVCTSHDLNNIEVALGVRRLNPHGAVIIRMFDQDLARRMEELLQIDRALAMSQISAPAFVMAAVGEAARGAFSFGDTRFVAVEDSRPVEMEAFFRRLGLDKDKANRAGRRRFGWREWRQAFQLVNPAFKWVALVLSLMFVVSVFIFTVGLKLSLVDAVYFVVTTLTTTGYGDITAREAHTWVKLYTCFIMVTGSVSIAVLYSLITDFIVTARFEEALGRGWHADDDHLIVVGLGSVGYRVVQECQEFGLPVAVVDIEPSPELLPRLGRTAFIHGDGRDAETLERAGLKSAVAVVACTQDDAVNLGIGLAVKKSRPETRTIVRLFDGTFARKVGDALKLDVTLSASRIAAPSFVGAALCKDALLSYVEADELVIVRPPSQDDSEFFVERHRLAAIGEEI